MEDLTTALFIFILAVYVGVEIISKVPPILHTPLMSGANAVSGITLIGALVCTGPKDLHITTILGMIAIIFATINVVGGFLVTDRMLRMFKRKS